MKATTIQKTIKRHLTKKGIDVRTGSSADRAIIAVASTGAVAVREGKRMIKRLNHAADATRASIHKATAPHN